MNDINKNCLERNMEGTYITVSGSCETKCNMRSLTPTIAQKEHSQWRRDRKGKRERISVSKNI